MDRSKLPVCRSGEKPCGVVSPSQHAARCEPGEDKAAFSARRRTASIQKHTNYVTPGKDRYQVSADDNITSSTRFCESQHIGLNTDRPEQHSENGLDRKTSQLDYSKKHDIVFQDSICTDYGGCLKELREVAIKPAEKMQSSHSKLMASHLQAPGKKPLGRNAVSSRTTRSELSQGRHPSDFSQRGCVSSYKKTDRVTLNTDKTVGTKSDKNAVKRWGVASQKPDQVSLDNYDKRGIKPKRVSKSSAREKTVISTPQTVTPRSPSLVVPNKRVGDLYLAKTPGDGHKCPRGSGGSDTITEQIAGNCTQSACGGRLHAKGISTPDRLDKRTNWRTDNEAGCADIIGSTEPGKVKSMASHLPHPITVTRQAANMDSSRNTHTQQKLSYVGHKYSAYHSYEDDKNTAAGPNLPKEREYSHHNLNQNGSPSAMAQGYNLKPETKYFSGHRPVYSGQECRPKYQSGMSGYHQPNHQHLEKFSSNRSDASAGVDKTIYVKSVQDIDMMLEDESDYCDPWDLPAVQDYLLSLSHHRQHGHNSDKTSPNFTSPSCGIRMAELRASKRTSKKGKSKSYTIQNDSNIPEMTPSHQNQSIMPYAIVDVSSSSAHHRPNRQISDLHGLAENNLRRDESMSSENSGILNSSGNCDNRQSDIHQECHSSTTSSSHSVHSPELSFNYYQQDHGTVSNLSCTDHVFTECNGYAMERQTSGNANFPEQITSDHAQISAQNDIDSSYRKDQSVSSKKLLPQRTVKISNDLSLIASGSCDASQERKGYAGNKSSHKGVRSQLSRIFKSKGKKSVPEQKHALPNNEHFSTHEMKLANGVSGNEICNQVLNEKHDVLYSARKEQDNVLQIKDDRKIQSQFINKPSRNLKTPNSYSSTKCPENKEIDQSFRDKHKVRKPDVPVIKTKRLRDRQVYKEGSSCKLPAKSDKTKADGTASRINENTITCVTGVNSAIQAASVRGCQAKASQRSDVAINQPPTNQLVYSSHKPGLMTSDSCSSLTDSEHSGACGSSQENLSSFVRCHSSRSVTSSEVISSLNSSLTSLSSICSETASPARQQKCHNKHLPQSGNISAVVSSTSRLASRKGRSNLADNHFNKKQRAAVSSKNKASQKSSYHTSDIQPLTTQITSNLCTITETNVALQNGSKANYSQNKIESGCLRGLQLPPQPNQSHMQNSEDNEQNIRYDSSNIASNNSSSFASVDEQAASLQKQHIITSRKSSALPKSNRHKPGTNKCDMNSHRDKMSCTDGHHCDKLETVSIDENCLKSTSSPQPIGEYTRNLQQPYQTGEKNEQLVKPHLQIISNENLISGENFQDNYSDAHHNKDTPVKTNTCKHGLSSISRGERSSVSNTCKIGSHKSSEYFVKCGSDTSEGLCVSTSSRGARTDCCSPEQDEKSRANIASGGIIDNYSHLTMNEARTDADHGVLSQMCESNNKDTKKPTSLVRPQFVKPYASLSRNRGFSGPQYDHHKPPTKDSEGGTLSKLKLPTGLPSSSTSTPHLQNVKNGFNKSMDDKSIRAKYNRLHAPKSTRMQSNVSPNNQSKFISKESEGSRNVDEVCSSLPRPPVECGVSEKDQAASSSSSYHSQQKLPKTSKKTQNTSIRRDCRSDSDAQRKINVPGLLNSGAGLQNGNSDTGKQSTGVTDLRLKFESGLGDPNAKYQTKSQNSDNVSSDSSPDSQNLTPSGADKLAPDVASFISGVSTDETSDNLIFQNMDSSNTDKFQYNKNISCLEENQTKIFFGEQTKNDECLESDNNYCLSGNEIATSDTPCPETSEICNERKCQNIGLSPQQYVCSGSTSLSSGDCPPHELPREVECVYLDIGQDSNSGQGTSGVDHRQTTNTDTDTCVIDSSFADRGNAISDNTDLRVNSPLGYNEMDIYVEPTGDLSNENITNNYSEVSAIASQRSKPVDKGVQNTVYVCMQHTDTAPIEQVFQIKLPANVKDEQFKNVQTIISVDTEIKPPTESNHFGTLQVSPASSHENYDDSGRDTIESPCDLDEIEWRHLHGGHQGDMLSNMKLSESGYDSWKSQGSNSTCCGTDETLFRHLDPHLRHSDQQVRQYITTTTSPNAISDLQADFIVQENSWNRTDSEDTLTYSQVDLKDREYFVNYSSASTDPEVIISNGNLEMCKSLLAEGSSKVDITVTNFLSSEPCGPVLNEIDENDEKPGKTTSNINCFVGDLITKSENEKSHSNKISPFSLSEPDTEKQHDLNKLINADDLVANNEVINNINSNDSWYNELEKQSTPVTDFKRYKDSFQICFDVQDETCDEVGRNFQPTEIKHIDCNYLKMTETNSNSYLADAVGSCKDAMKSTNIDHSHSVICENKFEKDESLASHGVKWRQDGSEMSRKSCESMPKQKPAECTLGKNVAPTDQTEEAIDGARADLTELEVISKPYHKSGDERQFGHNRASPLEIDNDDILVASLGGSTVSIGDPGIGKTNKELINQVDNRKPLEQQQTESVNYTTDNGFIEIEDCSILQSSEITNNECKKRSSSDLESTENVKVSFQNCNSCSRDQTSVEVENVEIGLTDCDIVSIECKEENHNLTDSLKWDSVTQLANDEKTFREDIGSDASRKDSSDKSEECQSSLDYENLCDEYLEALIPSRLNSSASSSEMFDRIEHDSADVDNIEEISSDVIHNDLPFYTKPKYPSRSVSSPNLDTETPFGCSESFPVQSELVSEEINSLKRSQATSSLNLKGKETDFDKKPVNSKTTKIRNKCASSETSLPLSTFFRDQNENQNIPDANNTLIDDTCGTEMFSDSELHTESAALEYQFADITKEAEQLVSLLEGDNYCKDISTVNNGDEKLGCRIDSERNNQPQPESLSENCSSCSDTLTGSIKEEAFQPRDTKSYDNSFRQPTHSGESAMKNDCFTTVHKETLEMTESETAIAKTRGSSGSPNTIQEDIRHSDKTRNLRKVPISPYFSEDQDCYDKSRLPTSQSSEKQQYGSEFQTTLVPAADNVNVCNAISDDHDRVISTGSCQLQDNSSSVCHIESLSPKLAKKSAIPNFSAGNRSKLPMSRKGQPSTFAQKPVVSSAVVKKLTSSSIENPTKQSIENTVSLISIEGSEISNDSVLPKYSKDISESASTGSKILRTANRILSPKSSRKIFSGRPSKVLSSPTEQATKKSPGSVTSSTNDESGKSVSGNWFSRKALRKKSIPQPELHNESAPPDNSKKNDTTNIACADETNFVKTSSKILSPRFSRKSHVTPPKPVQVDNELVPPTSSVSKSDIPSAIVKKIPSCSKKFASPKCSRKTPVPTSQQQPLSMTGPTCLSSQLPKTNRKNCMPTSCTSTTSTAQSPQGGRKNVGPSVVTNTKLTLYSSGTLPQTSKTSSMESPSSNTVTPKLSRQISAPAVPPRYGSKLTYCMSGGLSNSSKADVANGSECSISNSGKVSNTGSCGVKSGNISKVLGKPTGIVPPQPKVASQLQPPQISPGSTSRLSSLPVKSSKLKPPGVATQAKPSRGIPLPNGRSTNRTRIP